MAFDPSASFGKSLFFGEILEDQLFPYPEIDAETRETVLAVNDAVDKFMAGVDGAKLDRIGELPADLLQKIRELGLFGLIVPQQYGGLGLTNSGYARVIQEVAGYESGITVTIAAHSSIGLKGILLFGTEAQKKRWLPKLASGEMIAAFALTEPGSGSDAFSIKTRAEKKSDHYLLNGQKLWITNGGIADFFTVFAKTTPDVGETKGKITAFAVTRDLGGVTHGPHEDKMGIRASATNAVFFDNVKVPFENVIGEEGKGFKVAMSILNHGRTGLGAGAVGGQRRLLTLVANHAKERKQFGREIGSFGLVKEKIGRMATDCYVSEALCYWVASIIDRGGTDYSLEGAATKVFNSEALWRATDEALQIAGGVGYMKEYPYERAMRDARINRIFEGTNEILRLYVGLTGMQGLGEYLKGLGKDIANVFSDPIKGFGILTGYAGRKMRQSLPLGRTQVTRAHESLRKQVSLVEDAVQELASMAEATLRRHGKEIIGKQFATRRLADVTIDLIAMSAAISRTSSLITRRGSADKAGNELDMTIAFCDEAFERVRTNLRHATGKNHDEETKAVADRVMEAGGFPGDVLKG